MNSKQKLCALLTASAMLFGTIAPVFADAPYASTVRVDDASFGNHIFKAYQIFKGSEGLSPDEILNIEWGDDIDQQAFVNSLQKQFKNKDGNTSPFDQCTDKTPAYVAKQISELKAEYDSEAANKIAKIVLEQKVSNGGTELIPGNPIPQTITPGYYLIVDTASGRQDDLVTGYIRNVCVLKVVNPGNLLIKVKVKQPTLTNQMIVADSQTGDSKTEDWEDTVDYAMNETFQFKLTATIPAETRIENYPAYRLALYDRWSDGITFEDIESIKLNGQVVTQGTAPSSANVQEFKPTNEADPKMAISIEDIKPLLTQSGWNGEPINFEVICNVHLNEKAKSTVPNKEESTDAEENKAWCLYSNNPDVGVTGELTEGITPYYSSWAFTYTMPNKKVDGKEEPLKGAKFHVYKLNPDGSRKAKVSFAKNSEGYYYPINSQKNAVNLVSLPETGDFSIKGLSAGTYEFEEFEVPLGYNKEKTSPFVTITDSGSDDVVKHHTTPTGASVTAKMMVGCNDALVHKVINRSGAVLPETGGSGTAVFCTAGLSLTVGMGMLLIAKKRRNYKSE
ncbi:MAG: isopeptide-forming domain-containing fimbrial protein [Erysipelotrichaceae bacterium]|nr:isopeptide-forming domain-containing fimbrial protein [Erysipelotrichaceae bacterium]